MTMTAQGAPSRRNDGKSVAVVIPTGQSWDMGKAVYADGFHGVTMDAGTATDVVALDIEVGAVHELTVPGSVATAKGDKVYITTDGNHTLTATASGNEYFGKVRSARDSNNVAWIAIAAQ